jgi:hypothetical protein
MVFLGHLGHDFDHTKYYREEEEEEEEQQQDDVDFLASMKISGTITKDAVPIHC